MDLLDCAEDHRRGALDGPAHQVPGAAAVVYLGEPPFDRNGLAVRAGGHVAASQNAGELVRGMIELGAQDVGESAFAATAQVQPEPPLTGASGHTERLFEKAGVGFRQREYLLPRGAEVLKARQVADIGGLDDHDAPEPASGAAGRHPAWCWSAGWRSGSAMAAAEARPQRASLGDRPERSPVGLPGVIITEPAGPHRQQVSQFMVPRPGNLMNRRQREPALWSTSVSRGRLRGSRACGEAPA
jgi:hypothetical protein